MDPSKAEEFRKMLANFDTGLLVSIGHGQTMTHAQPVALGDVSGTESVWLALGVDAEPEKALIEYDRGLLVCQRPAKHLVIRGTIEVEPDLTQVAHAWRPHWEHWFPLGPTTPTLRLSRFHPEQAEYWDHSGLMRFNHVFEAARSLVRGARVSPRHEEHVRL